MTTPQQSVDADEIAHLIDEALGATGILPPMARLTELDQLLRAEVERLIPIVQRQADAAPLRSRQWYKLIQSAERAEDTLRYQVGAAPLVGSIQVAELARRVNEMREAGRCEP